MCTCISLQIHKYIYISNGNVSLYRYETNVNTQPWTNILSPLFITQKIYHWVNLHQEKYSFFFRNCVHQKWSFFLGAVYTNISWVNTPRVGFMLFTTSLIASSAAILLFHLKVRGGGGGGCSWGSMGVLQEQFRFSGKLSQRQGGRAGKNRSQGDKRGVAAWSSLFTAFLVDYQMSSQQVLRQGQHIVQEAAV